MVTSIGAALLILLFLNTIGSDLLKNVSGDGVKMLVFAGFCLLAAISAKAFINSLSKKALAEIEKVRDEAASVAERAEILAEKATEADEEQLPGDNLKFSANEIIKSIIIWEKFSIGKKDMGHYRSVRKGLKKFTIML